MRKVTSYKLRVTSAFLTVLWSYGLTVFISYGQISTREEPVSLTREIPAMRINEQTQKIMPFLDMNKIEMEDAENNLNDIPPRFGFLHETEFTLENSGEWVELPDGDKIWRLRIYCPNATSINLLYDHFWLPEGAKFFIYSNDYREQLGAFTSKNNKGKKEDMRGFATGLVRSNNITLEYYVPKEVKEMGVISICNIVHGYRNIFQGCVGYGCSGECQVNVNCPEGQNWQDEKNAVALMLVNGHRECTGFLINSTDDDGTPYFLTARHCLVGYDTIGLLSHFSFYWHYESPGCTSTFEPLYISTTGATIVASNFDTDFTLLLLDENEDPSNSMEIIPYYLGWDCSGNAGIGGVGIHHPMGDIKKISTYSMEPFNSYCYPSPPYSHWQLYFDETYSGRHSTTENVSSGSPLINFNHKVIGQLHGTGSKCSATGCNNPAINPASYGKFNVSWTGNGNPERRRRLDYWLDSFNTGFTIIDGSYGCKKKFTGHNINRDMDIKGCDYLLLQDDIVSNNAIVNISAGIEVNIKPGFHGVSGTDVSISITSKGTMLSPQYSQTSLNKEFYGTTNRVSKFSFHLLPNPNSGTFQIETNFPLTDIANLKVISLLGVTVYEAQNHASNTIQLKNSGNGLFFVVVTLNDGTVLTQKMMVQR